MSKKSGRKTENERKIVGCRIGYSQIGSIRGILNQRNPILSENGMSSFPMAFHSRRYAVFC